MLALINVSKWGRSLTRELRRRERDSKEISGLSAKTGLETQENDSRFDNRAESVNHFVAYVHLISDSLGGRGNRCSR